jgi:hypothetical protein
MDYGKLALNALLAGLWAGLATFATAQQLTKAAVFGAVTVAVRAAIGVITAAIGPGVPVDR